MTDVLHSNARACMTITGHQVSFSASALNYVRTLLIWPISKVTGVLRTVAYGLLPWACLD
jgi:hypothetical protein